MDRWWDSPEAATSNLALVDGSDPQMGVSVAVMGFHALTKAQLDRLATQTLVDRKQLEAAYDAAELEPVRKAVAAATTGDLGPVGAASYARVVVADWTARSKEASGRLATTLVAKGLPWPRAVSRTASVAGVPLERLGRYASAAAAPGLDPLSASDTADRVLMEYARQRGLMEAPASVVVSKEGRQRMRARQRQVKNPEFERQVERDALGQFAAENTSAAQKEREERKTKRMERRARRERHEQRVKTEETTDTPDATRASSGDATREAGQAQRMSYGPRDAGREQVAGRETPASRPDNLLLSRSVQSAPNWTDNPEPMVINEPLYMLTAEGPKGIEFLSHRAFSKPDLMRVAHNLAANGTRGEIRALEFPANALVVLGGDSGGLNSPRAFKVAAFESAADPRAFLDKTKVADASSGVRTQFGKTPDQQVRVEIWPSEIRKASEGRQRMTQRVKHRVKNPQFEQQVERDELGQFAVEGEDTAEAQKMRAERRAKRQERRARREKYAEQDRQQAKEAQGQQEATRATQGEATRQTEATREVQAGREAGREVEATREVAATRQSQDSKEALVKWIRGTGGGNHIFFRSLASHDLITAGFEHQPYAAGGGVEPSALDSLRAGRKLPLDEIPWEHATDVPLTQQSATTLQTQYRHLYTAKERRDRLSPVFEPPSNKELSFIYGMNFLSSRLHSTAQNHSAAQARVNRGSHTAPPIIAEDLTRIAGVEMGMVYGGQAARAGAGGAPTSGTPFAAEASAWGRMQPNMSGSFTIPPKKVVAMYGPQQPGGEIRAYESIQPTTNPPRHYVAVVTRPVADLMELIYNVTKPGSDPSTVVDRKAAAHELVERYAPDREKPPPMSQLITRALQREDVHVSMMSPKTKVEMAVGALQRGDVSAVRLDNFDVLRFY